MIDKANDTERQATVYKEKLKKLQLIIDSGKAKPEPTEMGAVKCVCCCRRMGRAGTSNRWRYPRWWTSHTESLLAALKTALTPETRASDRRGQRDPH